MDLGAIVGVAVGLAFTYLLLSLICSTIQEWIAGILRRRAANLREGLLSLLQDQNAVNDLYAHPLIRSLAQPSAKDPSRVIAYVPSNSFASALLDNVAQGWLAPGANIVAAINGLNIPNSLKTSLRALAEQAAGDRDAFFKAVEKWFNDTMDRVSGWYKRETQIVIITISVICTVAFNVDTIRITEELYRNAALRSAIEAAAVQYVETHKRPPTPAPTETQTATAPASSTDTMAGAAATTAASTADTTTAESTSTSATSTTDSRAQLQQHVDDLMTLDLPIGLDQGVTWWSPLGWLLTIAAVSLGAPFWFDTLVRIANIRNNGPKPGAPQRS